MVASRRIAPTEHPWVIVGCGFTGRRLARRLLDEGARVIATRRTATAADELSGRLGDGVETRVVDLAHWESLEDLVPEGAIVVDSAPPAGGTVAERNLVDAAIGARRLVYISSTGVFPRMEPGTWIDEGVAPDPFGVRGKARLVAESTLLEAAHDAGLEAVALRAPGIYGPGRGVHRRVHEGTHRVIGPGDTFVSRIHVEDLASAIIAAGTVEPLLREVYVVGDDEPTTSRYHADRVAERLGRPRSPTVPFDEVPEHLRAMFGANRRVDNARMKSELGVELRYPTWREGLEQVLAADGIS